MINFFWNNYLDIFIIHLLLAVLLFFLMNWFGKRAKGLGYTEIGIFMQEQDEPAFNFIYRILFPTVYIVLLSTFFKLIDADRYIFNVYLVTVYSIAIRFLFNLFSGRFPLLDKKKLWLNITVSVGLSIFVNSKIINQTNFLPDFNTMTNEVWLLIFIFIYQILNQAELFNNFEEEEKRKTMYLIKRYNKFKYGYGDIIDSLVNNERLKLIVYSIIIHESFNRYKIGRILVENNLFRFGKANTIGLMQVKSDKMISDEESVKIGTKKIVQKYNDLIAEYRLRKDEVVESLLEWDIIVDYNKDENYGNAVRRITDLLVDVIYKGKIEDLAPADLSKKVKKDVKKREG